LTCKSTSTVLSSQASSALKRQYSDRSTLPEGMIQSMLASWWVSQACWSDHSSVPGRGFREVPSKGMATPGMPFWRKTSQIHLATWSRTESRQARGAQPGGGWIVNW
jgi:hypothetical protein